ASGHWSFALDNTNAAVQALNVGDQLTETFTVHTADGTAQEVTITIDGANDAAVITGTSSGGVVEAGGVGNADAGTPTVGGDLNDTDVDNANDSWQTVPTATASDNGYGTYTMDASGHWSFALDNTNAAVQALNVGDQLTETFTVHTADGTAQEVTVTIHGTNDAAVITGSSSGSVTEDAALTVNGALTVNDPDAGQSSFQMHDGSNPITGTYGSLTIDAGGNWVYTLNNAAANVQALASADHPHDQIHVASADGTDHVIDITVNGADEPVLNHAPSAPVFVPSSTPSPDGQSPSLGSFVSTDPDAQDIVTFTGTFTAGPSSNGSVSVSSNGSLIVNVPTGQTLNGTLTVTATDNHAASSTPQTFSIWIGDGSGNGNDGIVLSSTNPNIADGRAGTDGLTGNSGVDYIFGGSGNDTIKGLGGADWLVGGDGADHFAYTAVADSTHAAFDTIQDFLHGTDKLDFLNALTLTGTPTNLGASTTLAAHSVGWTTDGTNTIVYANVGSSTEAITSGADVIEIHLLGVNNLSSADFNLHA
ncbi:VCBS domain-containing protein, partial [Mesorhizobium sp. MSK_1335]